MLIFHFVQNRKYRNLQETLFSLVPFLMISKEECIHVLHEEEQKNTCFYLFFFSSVLDTAYESMSVSSCKLEKLHFGYPLRCMHFQFPLW